MNGASVKALDSVVVEQKREFTEQIVLRKQHFFLYFNTIRSIGVHQKSCERVNRGTSDDFEDVKKRQKKV